MSKRKCAIPAWLMGMGLLAVALAVVAAPRLCGQEEPSASEAQPAPPGPDVTMQGVVLNEATGQPLARALVKVFSTPERGVLTDGEGRFEIHGVPAGGQTLIVSKPGFQEQIDSDQNVEAVQHVVQVAPGMAPLSFSLAPKNAIFGHVTLSTGVPAEGIGIVLVELKIENGRAKWVEAEHHQTTPDGAFRFYGLRDGKYLLMTEPEFDNSRAAAPSCEKDPPGEIRGYAAGFYGQGQDLAGASRIVVAGGQNAEANLALNLTTFHMFEASVARLPAGKSWEFTPALLDQSGQMIGYPIHEEKDHDFCSYLPDGGYTLVIHASPKEEAQSGVEAASAGRSAQREMVGSLDFSMEGQPARDLRLAMAPSPFTAAHFRYEPGPPSPIERNPQDGREEGPDENDPLTFSVTPAHVVSAGQGIPMEATATGPGVYELEAVAPGAYWLQVNADRPGVCVGSVTAGGQDLARVPWIAGASGTGAPIDVVLRTDCGKLTVQLPPGLEADSDGESANASVYVIPEFDSMSGDYQSQISRSGNGAETIADVTPGPYRVFAFRSPRTIEWRNPAALDRLGPGQRVTIGPHGEVSAVLKEVSK
jgi:hypothetical protein